MDIMRVRATEVGFTKLLPGVYPLIHVVNENEREQSVP